MRDRNPHPRGQTRMDAGPVCRVPMRDRNGFGPLAPRQREIGVCRVPMRDRNNYGPDGKLATVEFVEYL